MNRICLIILFFGLFACGDSHESTQMPFSEWGHNRADYQIYAFRRKKEREKNEREYENKMKQEEEIGNILIHVDQMPQFPGGQKAMDDFVKKNARYPRTAINQGIQGKVWIGFVVDRFGNIMIPEVLRGIGGGCDEEALRVIKSMPRWVPGKQNDSIVNVKVRVPIKFEF